MSVAQAAPSWRGVKQEATDEADASVGLRGPSRALLAELIRPWRAWLLFLVGVVVVEAGARLVVPVLVRRVLDDGLTGDAAVLVPSLAMMGVAILVQIVPGSSSCAAPAGSATRSCSTSAVDCSPSSSASTSASTTTTPRAARSRA